jgi:two-component system response regulator NreC
LEYSGEEIRQKIRIVLADDHRIVRSGLKALLRGESDFEVVGEAANGLEAFELVMATRPDILVLDLMMPVMNGLQVAARLAQARPGQGIVALSMHSDPSYITEMFRYGVRGYVLKDNTTDELITAIRDVYAGQIYLGPRISKEVRRSPLGNEDLATGDILKSLTAREREVFTLAVEGLTNSDIGRNLGISPRTVEAHCISLNHKLGVSNRTQLLHMAVQRGLLDAGFLRQPHSR